MKLQKYIFIILILESFFNCSDKEKIIYSQEYNGKVFDNKVKLIEIKKERFPLGKEESFWHYSWLINKPKKSLSVYFSFLNINNQSIVYYNIKTKKKKEIHLIKEGVNGLGFLPPNSTHFFNGINDFFVYNQSSGILFNIDSLGVVKNKFEIVDYKTSKDIAFPEPSGISPFVVKEDNIYFPCAKNKERLNYHNYGMVLKYNMKYKSYEYLIPLPNIYNKAFWGASFKYSTNFTFTDNDKILVLNYPVSPFLFRYNLSKNLFIDSIYVGSKYFSNIPPMSFKIGDALKKNRNYKKENSISLSTSDFSKIMYDKNTNLYYRVSFIRPSLDEVNLGNRIPDFSIIILDSSFKKIGEQRFSGKKYDVSTIAVTDEGIWLARKDLYTKDENNLVFSVFKTKFNKK